jgi:hypothetical protein
MSKEFCRLCNCWINLSPDAVRIGIGRGAAPQVFHDGGKIHLILRGAAKLKAFRENPPVMGETDSPEKGNEQ